VAFDGMLDALESAETDAHRAEDSMRQFLADASHDLRTPLAGVIGNAELLLRTNPPRDERETRLVDLIREAQRAARLVEDLLLITRLDTPQPTLRRQPVALTNLADRAITLARLRRPDRSITLTPAAAATVSGDPDHLHRALANLLDNATTATPPGGHITLPSPPPQAKCASPSPTPDPVSPNTTNTASSTASSASTPPARAQAPDSDYPSPAPSPTPTAATSTTYPPPPGPASTSPCPPPQPPPHQAPPTLTSARFGRMVGWPLPAGLPTLRRQVLSSSGPPDAVRGGRSQSFVVAPGNSEHLEKVHDDDGTSDPDHGDQLVNQLTRCLAFMSEVVSGLRGDLGPLFHVRHQPLHASWSGSPASDRSLSLRVGSFRPAFP